MRSERTMTYRPLILILFLAVGFAPLAKSQVPFIQEPMEPSAVAPGSSDFTLTVRGSGFVQGAAVIWNDQALDTTFVSATELKASVPASNVAYAGTARINAWNARNKRSNDAFLAISPPTSTPFEQIVRSAGDRAAHVLAADFNRDGVVDVALNGQTGSVEVSWEEEMDLSPSQWFMPPREATTTAW